MRFVPQYNVGLRFANPTYAHPSYGLSSLTLKGLIINFGYMESILEISPELDKNQSLYRIVDFFAAADIIESHRIRLSRADTFSDQNEGIESLLSQLETSGRTQSCGSMGWSDLASAKQKHINAQQSHYVSCWTSKPESVAMWSLYSPDHFGVRIKTSVEELQYVLLDFLDEKSFLKASQTDLGNHIVFATWMGIYPVSYTSLPHLLRKITRRVKAHGRIMERYRHLGLDLPDFKNIPDRYFEREKQRRFVISGKACYLKDSSFEHELEIRAVVRLGESKYNEMLMELKDALDPKDPRYDGIIFRFSELFGWVEFTELPRFEFARCSNNFVTSVTIDPRCPPHKRQFMEKWFIERDIKIEDSHCFGYIPDSFSVFPKS